MTAIEPCRVRKGSFECGAFILRDARKSAFLQRRAQLRSRRDEVLRSAQITPNLMVRSAATPRVSNHMTRTALLLVLVLVFLFLLLVVVLVTGRVALFVRHRFGLLKRQTLRGRKFGCLEFAQALVVFPGVEQ